MAGFYYAFMPDIVYDETRTEKIHQLSVIALHETSMQLGLIQVEIQATNRATGDKSWRYYKRYIYDLVNEDQQKAYLQRTAVGFFNSFTEPLASYTNENTPMKR